MIAHLRGKLLAKHPNQAIVETGGVGYDVTISVPTFSDLPGVGGEIALHIHTHVREDVIALYGFLRSSEKTLFEKLITVSGIGPKLAITILSGMAADEMGNAIRGNDIARLTRIPGIGKKTAERMVLELRDKLTVEKSRRNPRGARHESRRGRRALRADQSRISTAGGREGLGGGLEERQDRSLRCVVSRSSGGALEVILLPDAEPAENQIQDVIVGGGPGNFIERTQGAVEIKQDHLVRDPIAHRDCAEHPAPPVSRAPAPDGACW